MKDTKEFIRKVKNFTSEQTDAVQIVSESISSLVSSCHVYNYDHFIHASKAISHLIKKLDDDTPLFELIECLQEVHIDSFEHYVSKLKQKYPEFFIQKEDGSFIYDIRSAETKEQLDQRLVIEKWKKENPDWDKDDIPF